MMNPKHTRRGFTLMELLVVVLILGILTAVALPQYQAMIMHNKYVLLKAWTLQIAKVANIYYLANGRYPSNLNQLDIGIKSDYVCDTGWNGLIRCRDNKIQMGVFYDLSKKRCTCVAWNANQGFTFNLSNPTMQQRVCYKEIGKKRIPNANSFNAPEYQYLCQ